MLLDILRELKAWYVDPTFGGFDVDAPFATIEARIRTAISQEASTSSSATGK